MVAYGLPTIEFFSVIILELVSIGFMQKKENDMNFKSKEPPGLLVLLIHPSLLGEKYILVSAFNPKGIIAISLENGQQVKLLDQGDNPHFLSSGHLSFVAYGRLMVVPFDIKSLTINGKIVSIH